MKEYNCIKICVKQSHWNEGLRFVELCFTFFKQCNLGNYCRFKPNDKRNCT